MNNEEAKFVLHAYRPDGADAGDTAFASALEQARQDPVLAQWFARQQAFDRAVAGKLSCVEAPASLRASILAGAKVGRSREHSHRPWWRASWPLALAAGFAVLLMAGIALWPKTATAEDITAFAINDMLRESHEGGPSETEARFQGLLARAEQKLSSGVAVDFDALRNSGCRKVTYRGHELLEVCFKREGRWFHCYVARVQDFPALAARLQPAFTDKPGAGAAAWSDGQHIYVVASRAGSDAVRSLL